MKNRLLVGMAAAVTAALLFTSFPERSMAQGKGGGNGTNGLPDGFKAGGGKAKGKAKGPAGPTPRLADGHVNFGPIAGQKGTWNGGAGLTLVSNQAPDSIDNVLQNRPANPRVDDVPFLPWAKALYLHRRETLTADDPHVRCKSSAGARLYHTPYGFEIIQVPEMKAVFMMGVGGPHTYREVYMDGRPHPADIDPSYHGHSIGSWEGDTLVVDSIGFNTRFWFSREGLPHTEQLHTIEKFQRPDHNTLLYSITIDDPGAYTAPWTGGWTIPWSATGEMYEFICQENTRDSKHMFGGDSK